MSTQRVQRRTPVVPIRGVDTGSVTVIDTYLPRPGLLAALVAQLAAEIREGAASRPGRSRVYRTLDGDAVVVVTDFASREDKARWRAGAAFAAHLQRLAPFLDQVLSRSCELVVADAPAAHPAVAVQT